MLFGLKLYHSPLSLDALYMYLKKTGDGFSKTCLKVMKLYQLHFNFHQNGEQTLVHEEAGILGDRWRTRFSAQKSQDRAHLG